MAPAGDFNVRHIIGTTGLHLLTGESRGEGERSYSSCSRMLCLSCGPKIEALVYKSPKGRIRKKVLDPA